MCKGRWRFSCSWLLNETRASTSSKDCDSLSRFKAKHCHTDYRFKAKHCHTGMFSYFQIWEKPMTFLHPWRLTPTSQSAANRWPLVPSPIPQLLSDWGPFSPHKTVLMTTLPTLPVDIANMSFSNLFKKASNFLGLGGPDQLKPPPLDGEIIYCNNNVCVHPPAALTGSQGGEHFPGYLNIRSQDDEVSIFSFRKFYKGHSI